MEPIKPDLAWYTGVSQNKGVAPRCVFATVHRCPRYYQSLSLFGQYGGASQIDPAEDEALLKTWQGSDVWPVTREQATSVFGSKKDPKMFNNFCPEIAYDRFGWFATSLYHYTDQLDVDAAHAKLSRQGTHGEDWRWAWETIHPMHYTECPLYSLLFQRPPSGPHSKSPEKILELRPSFHGMSLDLNALLSRIRSWWRRKRATPTRET